MVERCLCKADVSGSNPLISKCLPLSVKTLWFKQGKALALPLSGNPKQNLNPKLGFSKERIQKKINHKRSNELRHMVET